MTAAWTIEDSNGQLLFNFVAGSPLDVGRRVLPTRYDAFRLQVSASYRQLFDRALRQVLDRQGWRIVRVRAAGKDTRAASGAAQPASCASDPSFGAFLPDARARNGEV